MASRSRFTLRSSLASWIMSITGKSPTKRTYEMISFYLTGWATREELEEHIKKLPDKVA
ncbi:MAG: hypothetical protein NTV29_13840 [Planctomycetota bacterium]|nr:hypothetical protein [Planctomycetota bacterium]